MWKPLSLAAVVIGTPVGAQTVGQWSVQAVLRSCEAASRLEAGETLSDAEIATAVRCVAFIRGVGGVLAYNCSSREEGYFPLYAAEQPPSLGAAIQAYVNWARSNPEFWGEDAQDGAILALMETFPCSML